MNREDYFTEVDYSLSINNNFDDDYYNYLSGCGRISVVDIDGHSQEAGFISFTVFSGHLTQNKSALFNVADAVSGDMLHLTHTFLRFMEQNELMGFKILLINYMKLNPQFRKEGFGTEALEDLIRFSGLLEVDYITLIPAPIEDLSDDITRGKAIRRIKRFYKKSSFEIVKPEEGEDIMYFTVNEILI